ncbi:TonB-dependent siderophore receptor [Apibacter muscae]|uniref:TonB-dependent siderophore receptor n=1 Tax=Apibacter muscae TaxID=2509004 RepID=UPI0011AC7267|nr:TonB-dependent siderophore receptor [Apibacter muscae]TWP31550.1 TonB-dependent siderophore receptor [Apibacter muscae]
MTHKLLFLPFFLGSLLSQSQKLDSIQPRFVEIDSIPKDTIILNHGSINNSRDSLQGVIVIGSAKKKYLNKNISSSLRLDEEIIKIPQNINIISNAALEDQQVTTLSDGVLRNVAGTQRLEHWADQYTHVNMRGSRASAFLNGVNITSNWGPLSEDMSYVDRIEFVKGPAGFLMSNGEPSGIYNIITKKPTGKELNGYARFTLGSFDLYRAEVDLDSKINDKISIRLNLMGQNKNSFRKYEFNDRYVMNPSIKINLTDQTTITAEYIYQKAKMSNIGSAYVFSYEGYGTKPVDYTLSDPGLAPTNIDSHLFNINLQHIINPYWKLTAQLTYLNEYTMGSSLWPSSFNPDGTMIRRVTLSQSSNIMKFGQVYLNGNMKTGVISHKILAGLDLGSKKYMADWNQWQDLDTEEHPFNTNSLNYQYPSNGYPVFNTSVPLVTRANPAGTIEQNYSGIYLQDVLGFFDDNLRLTIAGRYTDVKQNDYGVEKNAKKFTPRLGLSYSINENLSVYALYDQSFVPQAGFLRSGKHPKPVTGNNMELGLKKDWFNGKWNTVLSLYKIIKKDELTADPLSDPNEKYSIVLGKTRAEGIEFDLKGEIFKGFNIIVNYAFTENKVIESNTPEYPKGSRIAGYAKHTANAWLNYTINQGSLKGVGFTFGGTYLGDRSSWSWGGEGQIPMNDYLKFDAGISWEHSNMKLNLNVFNVFNRYLYSGSSFASYYYYQAEAPRNWRLSVGYKF